MNTVKITSKHSLAGVANFVSGGEFSTGGRCLCPLAQNLWRFFLRGQIFDGQ